MNLAVSAIVRFAWRRTLFVIAMALGSRLALDAAEPPAEFVGWMRRYCYECHDEATAKAKLSLETLPFHLDAPQSFKTWTRVHDRVASSQMPPSGKPQPTAAERAAFSAWLDQQLHDSSVARVRSEGRVPLRRLNRAELHDTLLDLLGVDVELWDLLPDDGFVSGFDKVSLGLETSSHHLVRYQEVAERALDAALPKRPVASRTVRLTARKWYETQRAQGGELAGLVMDPAVKREGETVLLYRKSPFHPYLSMEVGKPQVPGRYRVRASVAARQNGRQPISVLLSLSGYEPEFDNSLQRILAVGDVSSHAFTTLEFQVDLPFGSRRWPSRGLQLSGWTLPQQPMPDAIRADNLMGVAPDWSGPALAVQWIELEGPLPSVTNSPLADISRLIQDPTADRPSAALENGIRRFLPLAFRRPVSEQEAESFLHYGASLLNQGESLPDAMRASFRAILCAPQFWMRRESAGILEDDALASRLSYFIWNSMPDASLLDLAKQKRLAQPEVLLAECERMLKDPKSDRFVERFTSQWLDLRRLYDTKPDRMYGEFDEQLLWSMPQETREFFREMIRDNGPVVDWVQSKWTYVNWRLAEHYGLSPVLGSGFQKVTLPASSHRGGVLTHASVLKVTANGTTTSPVLRGKWVLEKILGTPPAPPPPDIPVLEPDIRGATTIRQQLDLHRHQPMCASCHRVIDPPGFALESFDVIGGWRDWYRVKDDRARRAPLPAYPHLKATRGPTVELGYTMADGRSFDGIDQYRAILAEDPESLARGLLKQLIIYATGSELQYSDRRELDRMIERLRPEGFRFRSMIREVVTSQMFLQK